MKPHPRIRKAALWGGGAMTVALLALWIVSGWWTIGYSTRTWLAGVILGQVGFQWSRAGPWAVGWSILRVDSRYQWRWWYTHDPDPIMPYVALPIWPFVAAFAATTAYAFHRERIARRNARLGLCPHCNYNRTGLAPTAVCPECGAAPIASTSA